MIAISNLVVTFGGVTSIDDLSVTFDEPVTGIVGPNGAGKTTLLNVLSGFVRPKAGEVRLDGRPILGIAPHRRAELGIRRTFQTEQVVENLSIIDNVRSAADQLALGRGAKAAVDRALDAVGLRVNLARRGGELSLFERRLLEIARAAVGRPRVMLMDEPGAGLSDLESRRLRDVLAELPIRSGTQILLVDHDTEFITATCSATLVLDFGGRIAYGRTAEVLADPRVRAAYLGVMPETVA